MSVRTFCKECNCYHPPHAHDSLDSVDIAKGYIEYLNKMILKYEEDIKVLHRNCDPAGMTYEDHLVWEKWNK